ncbi:hypothetical protein ASPTUDRAFT_421446 [Aspergillus tubingensis CBS 134.48]|uniref:Uncharacterized protein n=1 Tax=Aspergillus tubingensis (strain CBS 134.48) TaxID=767770 RepID=A0A1L9NES1_ASPTC|nr:hypothetical protein ASPTUDRAFT_421446 [Aspergillus tubingensis CBS 134.48]
MATYGGPGRYRDSRLGRESIRSSQMGRASDRIHHRAESPLVEEWMSGLRRLTHWRNDRPAIREMCTSRVLYFLAGVAPHLHCQLEYPRLF